VTSHVVTQHVTDGRLGGRSLKRPAGLESGKVWWTCSCGRQYLLWKDAAEHRMLISGLKPEVVRTRLEECRGFWPAKWPG
jgi:hypothetical protein